MFQLINDVLKLLQDPHAVKLIIVAAISLCSSWVFTAAVSAMPMPSPTDSKRYVFWFRFLNKLAGTMKRAEAALKVPGAEEDK